MSVCHILHKYYKERIEADLTIEQLCELFREIDAYHGINRDEEKPAKEPQRAPANNTKNGEVTGMSEMQKDGEITARCDKG